VLVHVQVDVPPEQAPEASQVSPVVQSLPSSQAERWRPGGCTAAGPLGRAKVGGAWVGVAAVGRGVAGERAVRLAAVERREVAVVAFLAGLDDAVAADRHGRDVGIGIGIGVGIGVGVGVGIGIGVGASAVLVGGAVAVVVDSVAGRIVGGGGMRGRQVTVPWWQTDERRQAPKPQVSAVSHSSSVAPSQSSSVPSQAFSAGRGPGMQVASQPSAGSPSRLLQPGSQIISQSPSTQVPVPWSPSAQTPPQAPQLRRSKSRSKSSSSGRRSRCRRGRTARRRPARSRVGVGVRVGGVDVARVVAGAVEAAHGNAEQVALDAGAVGADEVAVAVGAVARRAVAATRQAP